MFGPVGSHEQANGRLLRSELGESVSHARRAAGYAAIGVRDALQPKLVPAKQRARNTAAKLKRTRTQQEQQPVPARPRRPRLFRLLMMGALIGAVGAVILRRRRERQWESYDPIEAVQQERDAAITEPARRPTGPAA